MLQGKYLNPKYAVRRKKQRRAILVTCVLTLLVAGVGTVWQVDLNIRASMLPAAPPVAAVTRQQPLRYHISLFGREFTLSFAGVAGAVDELTELLRTPPAPVRLCYQLRAYLTGEVPRNRRADSQSAYEG